MDIERAIEFLMKNQAEMDARFNAKFDRAEERFIRAEKRMDRVERTLALNNRVVARLARAGGSLRSDVRRFDKAMTLLAERQAESEDKLNALIEFVDQQRRGNGGRRQS